MSIMTEPADASLTLDKTASCCCGALQVTLTGAPLEVYACSCQKCQRTSGTAFTYTAYFLDSAITSLIGEHRSWRRLGASGEWAETSFCPTCGSPVFSRLSAWPGVLGVAIGCLTDVAFQKPSKLFWSSERHRWLAFPPDIEIFDTQ